MQMEQAADIERSLSADLKEVRAALADAEKSLAEETASAKRRAKWKEQHMQQLEATEAACAERYSDNDTFKFALVIRRICHDLHEVERSAPMTSLRVLGTVTQRLRR